MICRGSASGEVGKRPPGRPTPTSRSRRLITVGAGAFCGLIRPRVSLWSGHTGKIRASHTPRSPPWTPQRVRGNLASDVPPGLSPCAGRGRGGPSTRSPAECPPTRRGFLRLGILVFLLFCGCVIRIRDVGCLGGPGTAPRQPRRNKHGAHLQRSC